MKKNTLFQATLLAGLVSLSPLNDAHAFFNIDEATWEMQVTQHIEQTWQTAELVAQTIEEKLQTVELIQQTINDRINLVMKPYTEVMGLMRRFEGLITEVTSLQNQFIGMYEDPMTQGNIFNQIQYNQRRLNRNLDRMQRLNERAERVGSKIGDVNEAIIDLGNANESSEGNTALQQVGNEAALLNANIAAENLAAQQEILLALERQSARDEETRQLALARNCELWQFEGTKLIGCP